MPDAGNTDAPDAGNADAPDAADADAGYAPKITLMGDGAYSDSTIHAKCASLGTEMISPVMINSVARANSCQERKKAVLEQLGDLHDSGNAGVAEFADMSDSDRRRNREKWKKRVGYGRRWLVEIAFSAFKHMFGRAVMARTMENITKEAMFKVCTYNRMLWITGYAMFA